MKLTAENVVAAFKEVNLKATQKNFYSFSRNCGCGITALLMKDLGIDGFKEAYSSRNIILFASEHFKVSEDDIAAFIQGFDGVEKSPECDIDIYNEGVKTFELLQKEGLVYGQDSFKD